MSQILIVIGASILGLLGAIHLFYTFCSNKFEAYDQSVTQAMKGTSPILTKETTVWRAWVGFNASHSLGALLFACIYIPLTTWHFTVIQQSSWFTCLPIIVGLAYLVLAKLYWFKVPFIGLLLATFCFVGGALLVNT
jgi:hypothetical protein